MAFKERTKSMNLRIYEILASRMRLDKEDYYYYLNLKKGYEGECRFDGLTEKLGAKCIILNDLQLEIRRSSLQIDALLICEGKIVLYEIKNYGGVHHWGPEEFMKQSGTTLENPSLQLTKTKVRLRKLLKSLGYSMEIEAFIVYVNPEFSIWGAPYEGDSILPGQISEHFRELQNMKPVTNPELEKLAQALVECHDPEYPSKLIKYEYEKMNKGIICPTCGLLVHNFCGRSHMCESCGKKMIIQKAISNSISDFHTLFPNEKLTTKRLADWCGTEDTNRVYKVLKREYQAAGSESCRYYIPVNEQPTPACYVG